MKRHGWQELPRGSLQPLQERLWALPSSSLLKGLPLPSRTRLSLLCPPRITPCPGPEQLGASQRVLREMINISQEDVSAIQYLTLPSLRLQKGLPLLSGKGLSLCRPFSILLSLSPEEGFAATLQGPASPQAVKSFSNLCRSLSTLFNRDALGIGIRVITMVQLERMQVSGTLLRGVTSACCAAIPLQKLI